MKKNIDKLPFFIHKNLRSYFDQLRIKNMNLERKYSLLEYNKKCQELSKFFIKEATK